MTSKALLFFLSAIVLLTAQTFAQDSKELEPQAAVKASQEEPTEGDTKPADGDTKAEEARLLTEVEAATSEKKRLAQSCEENSGFAERRIHRWALMMRLSQKMMRDGLSMKNLKHGKRSFLRS